MATARLEVRLDEEHCRKPKHIAAEDQAQLSQTIRRLIDEAYEDRMYARRKQAVLTLMSLEIEDVPEPDVLSRQLEEAHDPGPLY
ncbi:MAG: hypothetical protein EXR51_03285 [Dehalococcoidia bacterium]|nr:hypothetical protein [Dehalococcoidia bacterium]